MSKIRNDMIQNVCAYNKHQNKKDLQEKSDEILLANCHPTDRERFVTKLNHI